MVAETLFQIISAIWKKKFFPGNDFLDLKKIILKKFIIDHRLSVSMVVIDYRTLYKIPLKNKRIGKKYMCYACDFNSCV